jgi:hypothetical protein
MFGSAAVSAFLAVGGEVGAGNGDGDNARVNGD